MNNKLNLLSDQEPTDEQLSLLMKEVAKDVRFRAIEADKKFQQDLKKQVKETLMLWKKQHES